jgi:hypothetical protein
VAAGGRADSSPRRAALRATYDNNTLYAGSVHVPLQRYGVASTHAVTQVCARAGNADLTRAQWRTYVPDAPYRRVCGH